MICITAGTVLASSCATTPDRSSLDNTWTDNTWEGVTVTGKLMDDQGQPVQDGHVYAYVQGNSTLGPADAMSEPSEADGRYVLILPPGRYTLVARKRMSGSISGPVRGGDLTRRLNEPFRAEAGTGSTVNFKMIPFRQGADGDPDRNLVTSTRVRGYVTDRTGRPVEGVHIFAFKGAFRQTSPDFMAPASAEDGAFEISLPEGGKYVIGARTGSRGKPGPGDWLGFRGGEAKPFEIQEGSITEGVRIIVERYEKTE